MASCPLTNWQASFLKDQIRSLAKEELACLLQLKNNANFKITQSSDHLILSDSLYFPARDQVSWYQKWGVNNVISRKLHSQFVFGPQHAKAGDVRDMGWSLGLEDPLEKGMTTHAYMLAWKIPWTEASGGLHSGGSQKVRYNWVGTCARVRAHTHTHTHTHTHPGNQAD